MPISLKHRQTLSKQPQFPLLVQWAGTQAATDILGGEGNTAPSYPLRVRRAIQFLDNPALIGERLQPIIAGAASDPRDLRSLADMTAIVKTLWVALADAEQGLATP